MCDMELRACFPTPFIPVDEISVPVPSTFVDGPVCIDSPSDSGSPRVLTEDPPLLVLIAPPVPPNFFWKLCIAFSVIRSSSCGQYLSNCRNRSRLSRKQDAPEVRDTRAEYICRSSKKRASAPRACPERAIAKGFSPRRVPASSTSSSAEPLWTTYMSVATSPNLKMYSSGE